MATRSPPRRASFIHWMKSHYDQYLDEQETEGGWCEDWITRLIRDALADTGKSGAYDALAELIARTGRGHWHTDPPPEQLDLFSVAGIDVQHSYTFVDATVPGQFRRVTARWAATRHVVEDAIVARSKADEANAAARRKAAEAATIMARAGGDPDKLIWDIRDGTGMDSVGPQPQPTA
jgi:hypothetical protein